MARWLSYDALLNARDLGGLPTRDGRAVAPGRVLRGDTVVHLTPAGADRLVTAGLTGVLDLRSHFEVAADGHGAMRRWYEDGSVAHRHVTLVSDDGFKRDPVGRTDQLDQVTTAYLGYLEHGGARLAHELADAIASGPVYLHCAAGKDRTGTVTATLLDALDVADGHIVADYVASTVRLRRLFHALWQRPAYTRDAGLGVDAAVAAQACRAETMRAFLAELRARHGGGAAWLRSHGVDVAAVRETLVV